MKSVRAKLASRTANEMTAAEYRKLRQPKGKSWVRRSSPPEATSPAPSEPSAGFPTPRVWCLPYAPVTANRYLRMHWTRRRLEGHAWHSYIVGYAGRPPDSPPRKARVSIVVRRKRLQDPDNAYASCKPVLDALVRRGWLWDDSGRHLELDVREELLPSADAWKTSIKWEVIS